MVSFPVPALLREGLVLVVGVVVASHAAEQGHVAVGEGAPEGEGLPDVHLVEGFSKPPFELLWRLRHLPPIRVALLGRYSHLRRLKKT
jgi:hypothetical protein